MAEKGQVEPFGGHSLVDVGYGRVEAGGWYLVRRVNGHYDLRQLPASPGSSLVSVRAIRGSPFAQQAGWVYFAGYDANKMPAHNTAWIIGGPEAAAISGPWRTQLVINLERR